jgi:hypothetical protein
MTPASDAIDTPRHLSRLNIPFWPPSRGKREPGVLRLRSIARDELLRPVAAKPSTSTLKPTARRSAICYNNLIGASPFYRVILVNTVWPKVLFRGKASEKGEGLQTA